MNSGALGRWQGQSRHVILDTSFGTGERFLATRQAWRDDPYRCARLVFIAVEPHPPSRDQLAELLQSAWPPLTRNLHALAFDEGRVQLLLAVGEVSAWLPELVALVDAFHLDGATPMWDQRACKALSRLAAPDATLFAEHATPALRAHLITAGFELMPDEEVGTTRARYAPTFTPRRAPGRIATRRSVEPRALIIGGGLAGCATASALAEQGWHSTVFERHAQVAAEASGNPAGLFHGIVNAQDGVHARFNRAAALMARQAVQIAIDAHGVAGAVDGLLRLDTASSHAGMRATLAALGLPAEYVQALTAEQAGATSGIVLSRPAWFYPGGGWVHPAGLARAWLERAEPFVEWRCNADVRSLQRTDTGWRLLDAAGTTLAEAPTVVLANAGTALTLLGSPDWPIDPVRGQISLLPASALALPRVPVAGTGYLLPELAGGLAMFGATSQRFDDDASVRADDHRANLVQLAQLLGHAIDANPAAMQGRTAWRWSAIDRLPVIGAVPDAEATAQRLDQPRFVPRLPGLFVFTALGSRGITWSALGAQVLTSLVTGAPAPLEASLIDAIDPARFVSRRARREPVTEARETAAGRHPPALRAPSRRRATSSARPPGSS
ncbi:MAG: FAD-dependent 5-carboxymethylaminomethyl-2-thiouridine(34) oxidoreductase MnmC [Burkholderiales bacterium]